LKRDRHEANAFTYLQKGVRSSAIYTLLDEKSNNIFATRQFRQARTYLEEIDLSIKRSVEIDSVRKCQKSNSGKCGGAARKV